MVGSDVQMLHSRAPECYPFPPGTTGHEMVGVVEQVAADAHVQPGDLTLTLAPGHRAMCERYLAKLDHVLLLPKGKPLETNTSSMTSGPLVAGVNRPGQSPCLPASRYPRRP